MLGSVRINTLSEHRSGIVATLLALAVLLSPAAIHAQEASTTSDTYGWNARLVQFDQSSNTVTVEAPVFGAAVAEMARFKNGDRVLLRWDAFDTRANAVSHVTPYAASTKDPYVLPAEFVLPVTQTEYVAFRFHVKPGAADAVKSLKPGDWVHVKSRNRPASDADAFVAVTPYTSQPAS